MHYIIGGLALLILLLVLYKIGGLNDTGFRKLVKDLHSNNLGKDKQFDVNAWRRMKKGKEAMKEERQKRLRVLKNIALLVIFIAMSTLFFRAKWYGTLSIWLLFWVVGFWRMVLEPYLKKKTRKGD